jgi:hypothetical protein
MKKFGLYILMLLTLGLAACSEDIPAPSTPLSNPQERLLETGDISFTPTTVTEMNLPTLIEADEPIVLGNITMADNVLPEGTTLIAKIEMSENSDYTDSVFVEAETIGASKVVAVRPSNLQRQYYDNFHHNPSARTMYLRTHLYTVTGMSSEACIGDPKTYLGNYTVQFTPVREIIHNISSTYYVVVKNLDGTFTKVKFDHSEKDVYDDPRFTATINANKDASGLRVDTEYGIVSEDDIAAFDAGDLSVVYGKKDKNASTMEKGAPFIVGPAEDFASQYNLVINMEFFSIDIEDVILFYYYYIFGVNNMKPADNETALNYMFYKTTENVYKYTTFWPNSDEGKSIYNLKVGEHKDFNTTNNHWGTARAKQAESGNLTQKSQTFGPMTEGWYTLTITMNEDKNIHTYEWTAIAEPSTTYSEVSIVGGDVNEKMTECAKAKHNWYLLKYTLSADTQLKFSTGTKTWGGDGSQSIGKYVYTVPTGEQDITVPAGTYNFYLNDITGDWSILKVE